MSKLYGHGLHTDWLTVSPFTLKNSAVTFSAQGLTARLVVIA